MKPRSSTGYGDWPRLVASLSVAMCMVLGFGVSSAQSYPRPGTLQRVSLGCGGVQTNGDSAGIAAYPAYQAPPVPTISANGRFVAFTSSATNLTGSRLPVSTSASEVYEYDRSTGCSQLASVSSAGVPGTVIASPVALCPGAYQSSVSADGRYVAFTSCYQLLDGGPTVPTGDVFVHDFATGRTTKVSVAANGGLANGGSNSPSISADGRYVAFQSAASNLAKLSCPSDLVGQTLCGQSSSSLNVYVRDMVRGSTRLVSVALDGSGSDGYSSIPAISTNGHFVAFTSDADNLVTNDRSISNGHATCLPTRSPPAPSCPNVYLANLQTGKVQLVSVALTGQAPTHGYFGAESGGYQLGISPTGRYVAFTSDAADLVPNDVNGQLGPGRIYVRDTVAGRTTRAWVDSAGGNVPNSGGTNVAIDSSGRYVYFDDAFPSGCVYSELMMHDSFTGATVPLDRLNKNGQQNGCVTADGTYNSFYPSTSPDGRLLAFASDGTTLVAGDSNGKRDIFVRDVGTELGVGGLVRAGRLTVAGAPGFSATGLLAGADLKDDVNQALSTDGGKLLAATVAYRAASHDLFIRLIVKQMPTFALANPALLYGLTFTANDVRYEVRAAKVNPLEASFGLFKGSSPLSLPVAQLRGGYGTAGQEVDIALPLRSIGLDNGGQLGQLRAFTALGSYAAGSAQTINEIALTQ
jgi:Tol biopolymer transport system component